jgi:hypothetical protein
MIGASLDLGLLEAVGTIINIGNQTGKTTKVKVTWNPATAL